MPKKPQETSFKPPKPPRERLSLPLAPHLTKAVQAIAKAYGRPQAQVLADLLGTIEVDIVAGLELLQAKYEAAQREALAGVLGRAQKPPVAALGQNVVSPDEQVGGD